MMWDLKRMTEENAIRDKFGLKNMREVWKAKSELRRIRGNVRDVLSTKSPESIGKQIISRLSKLNVVKKDASLDDILVVNIDSILERRLQTVVFKKGMARSIKQARQLITHGFVSINGKRVTSPSYIVRAEEEDKIGLYKPIDLAPKEAPAPSQQPEPEKKE